jgi:putative spermidine/putrescine transport system ATP-binding protein
VDEALALVRLETQSDKLPGQLSGGQQQRVAIARAIVVEPPLVLMDEPLSNLDAKLRLEMRAEIRRIHTMLGCSTIYVTHDQEEALSLADRIMVMIDGLPRQIGTPEELYARPASADVAEFMGYRNLVPSPAEMEGSSVAVTVSGARILGTPMATIGGRATVAIRPDDLRPTDDGSIAALVEIAEYHGRDFYAVARGTDGEELYFRSDRRIAAGETVRLTAAHDRVLVYPA